MGAILIETTTASIVVPIHFPSAWISFSIFKGQVRKCLPVQYLLNTKDHQNKGALLMEKRYSLKARTNL